MIIQANINLHLHGNCKKNGKAKRQANHLKTHYRCNKSELIDSMPFI